MPVIKQKTIGDTTLVLKRAETFKSGKQYEYFVAEQGGGPVTDPVYTREDGMQQFRETVTAYDRANAAEQRERGPPGIGGGFFGDGGGGGLFGGGEEQDTEDRGPVGVGMGFFDADGDGEDDEPPEFRFL